MSNDQRHNEQFRNSFGPSRTIHMSQVPANDYATSWACSWADPKQGAVTPKELDLLHRVNCSYLSSGTPPTLLALKQHAQSLTNLIKKLSVSTSFGIVNGVGEGNTILKFNENEAFDWLNNLDEPYRNDDEAHNWPLWAVANHVKGEHEVDGVQFHCPLETAHDFGSLAEKGATVTPFRTHQNLAMHANECLEILDHEYSASGGLLSLLPAEEAQNEDEMTGVRNTLLGQWLLHHQHLVGRMHELEIDYARALDMLAGEAVVPAQKLSRLGPEGRLERPIAFPQDRFILANAGDDVTDFLHRRLDQVEAQTQGQETTWKNSGVSGERMWAVDSKGEPYERGLVKVEYTSRFCRLRGHGSRSTIFVLPVANKHPAVKATRDLESRPTVVSVVTPTWPERVTELEQKFREPLAKLAETETLNRALVRERVEMKEALDRQNTELRRNNEQLGHYESTIGKDSKKTQDMLLERIKAYQKKLHNLKKELPRQYHNLLGED